MEGGDGNGVGVFDINSFYLLPFSLASLCFTDKTSSISGQVLLSDMFTTFWKMFFQSRLVGSRFSRLLGFCKLLLLTIFLLKS